MLTLRPSNERGHADHGWLNTYHTFSFSSYQDPKHLGFRSLRVINEDYVGPGEGFGMHPHRDMEILTYIVSGTLEHKDSLGNTGQIVPGQLQRISAGTGILHSEYNPSDKDPVHLLQIWIRPNRNGHTPGYEQKDFPIHKIKNHLVALANPEGEKGALKINQDTWLFSATLESGHSIRLEDKALRHAWIQVVKGGVEVNGVAVKTGDGLAVSDEKVWDMQAKEDAEFLLFDLA